MFQKRIQGALYGMCSPAKDVPRLLSLWQDGRLKLEELVTRTYALDELNQGYEDMHAGVNVRGVLDLAELGRTGVTAARAAAAA
jgi:S-(hydroxymethyl)glutathione dehydrogenase/alcohol dehydrogenase